MSLLSVSTSAGLDTLGTTAALEGSAVNVDLDASLLVQLGLFVVLLVILKPLLFDPMMKLFEEREKRIEGTRREATKEDERSAKALAKYEAILAKAREAGGAERDAIRGKGAKEEAELMAGVRKETTATLEQGRKAITDEVTTAREQLKKDAAALAREIATRVLGREVSS